MNLNPNQFKKYLPGNKPVGSSRMMSRQGWNLPPVTEADMAWGREQAAKKEPSKTPEHIAADKAYQERMRGGYR